MSTAEDKLTPAGALVVIPRPARRAKIREADAIPRREVEIVTAEEKRHDDQVQKKAKKPESCFVSSASMATRSVVGIETETEVLHGFLAAAEKAASSDAGSMIRLSYEPGDGRMFIESPGPALWTVVALKVEPHGNQGFSVIVPPRRARSATNAMRTYEKVVAGISDGAFWIGQHCVPTPPPSTFPSRPLIREWEARAVIPAFYFEEICSRLLTVASKDPTAPGLHGVLLDFSIGADDAVSCTAVSSDGSRMHVLELPRMKIQPRGRTAPPCVMVGEPFFRYLRTVANREWTAMEISEAQVVGRGEDYQAIAPATMKGSTSTKGLENWKTVNVDHPGSWIVDCKELENTLKKIIDLDSPEIDLRIDALTEQLDIWFIGEGNRKIHETIGARRFDGPAAVDVTIDARFLLAAVIACKSGLIRLGFATKDQTTSPVTIRGESDQFKAIVMPIGR